MFPGLSRADLSPLLLFAALPVAAESGEGRGSTVLVPTTVTVVSGHTCHQEATLQGDPMQALPHTVRNLVSVTLARQAVCHSAQRGPQPPHTVFSGLSF